MTAYETTLGHHKTNWVSMAPRPGPQMWGWPPEKKKKKTYGTVEFHMVVQMSKLGDEKVWN